MFNKNSTLEEMIQFFYDNYDYYLKKARANTHYDSLGRIILEDYDDLETAE